MGGEPSHNWIFKSKGTRTWSFECNWRTLKITGLWKRATYEENEMKKELIYLQTEVCYLQKNLERTDICDGERESINYEIIKIQRDIFMFSCINGINPGVSSTYFNPFYPWRVIWKKQWYYTLYLCLLHYLCQTAQKLNAWN